MKKLLFSLFLFAGYANAQQGQVSLYTFHESPFKAVMPNMNDNWGIGTTFAYKPLDRVPGFLELDLSTSRNSSFNVSRTAPVVSWKYTPYTYQVNYITNVNKILIGTKFITGNDYSLFRFYATPQIGLLAFKSSVTYPNLQHPFTSGYSKNNDHDDDDVQHVTTKFQHSMVQVYGGQIGTEISLNRMFNKQSSSNNRLIISANFLRSCQTLDYTNMSNIRETNVAVPNQNVINLPNNSTTNENASTEVNHSKLMMWGIHVGYVFNF